jgi:hypothetical protein
MIHLLAEKKRCLGVLIGGSGLTRELQFAYLTCIMSDSLPPLRAGDLHPQSFNCCFKGGNHGWKRR